MKAEAVGLPFEDKYDGIPADQPRTVAVKMLKEGHTDHDVIDLVKEMEIMKAIGSHPNIVNLVGVCTGPVGKPLYLVMEHAELGCLK